MKVDEVRHWITLALNARPGSVGACRLLALVGPPGSAKSTMVRLLAQDMDVELVEWQVWNIFIATASTGETQPPGALGERRGQRDPVTRWLCFSLSPVVRPTLACA